MKILFLALDVDLAASRGDSMHTRELGRFLAARGNEVELVTATSSSVSDLSGNGLRHHFCPPGSDWTIANTCVRIARQTEADVVYERRLSPKISFAIRLLIGLPFVLEINGTEAEAELMGRKSIPVLDAIKRGIRGAMIRRASRAVTVSEGLANYVQSRHRLQGGRLVSIPNGVDLVRYAPMDRGECIRRLGLEDRSWIMFVGNLAPWQGLDTLIHAARRIIGEVSNAQIAIVGDGILRPHLERGAASVGCGDRISFFGEVPNRLVPLYLGAASVCVAPFTKARNEAIGLSPLKLYEYLSCGRPVVASKLPGVEELVRSSGAGILVPADNADALAEAVIELLRNPERAQDLGRNGRDFAARECSWAKTAERVEEVLRRAVEEA